MKIRSHRDLEIYGLAFGLAMEIFHISKKFPAEAKYSLTTQMRRSSGSVCANLAEAFRKRRYLEAFVARLSDAEAEADDTRVWLEFATKYEYIDARLYPRWINDYELRIGMIFNMAFHPEKWKY